jgi:hypothetical protein
MLLPAWCATPAPSRFSPLTFGAAPLVKVASTANRLPIIVADEIDQLLSIFHAHMRTLASRGVQPHLDAVERVRGRDNLRQHRVLP